MGQNDDVVPSRWRRILNWALRWSRQLVVEGLLGSIALGVLGQVVRDRSAKLAVLMYLPLPLIGLAAIGFDLICRGRAWPVARGRFTLAGVGLATVLGGTVPLVGWGGFRAGSTALDSSIGGRSTSVLHWNVVWGGGRRRDLDRWASIRSTIVAQGADLIVLSEAPPDDWLDQLVADLGPAGSRVQVENPPTAKNWYKMAVCSTKPLRLVRQEPVRNGAAMVVEAGAKNSGDLVRLLVVDGLSNPYLSRSPFLDDLARLCDRAQQTDQPIDLVVGDFNSLAQSVGFDALATQGYTLASRSRLGNWRGTFPSFIPVYDIDHIWVRPNRWLGVSDRFFTNFASDHRGQVARLWITSPEPATPP